MNENAEMQPRVTMEYRPHEGRVIRIEEPIDEQSRKAGVTAAALELHPISPGVKPAESLIAGLITAFSLPSRKWTYAPEGWESRRAEWERQQKLADVRSQLK